MKAVCTVCPHRCALEEGQTGLCRARINRDGRIVCKNYGKITSIALDPVEKKPLRRFHPGGKVLSVGSFGCNFHCPFCQNHEISMAGPEDVRTVDIPPQELVRKAAELLPYGNIGIAYTYNEPLVGFEYVRDCARLASEKGLKNVLVTNGYVSAGPLKELLPYIDAMNVDLKGFTEDFYERIGGGLATVERTIRLAAAGCHVELTTLIIPGKNDGGDEMERLSEWVASVGRDIPLHVTRFFPRWKMADREPTPVETVYRLAEIARKNLDFVYVGNC